MALTIANTGTIIPVSNGITTPAAITIIHHYHYTTITFTTITSFSTLFNTDTLTIAITSVFSGQGHELGSEQVNFFLASHLGLGSVLPEA